MKRKNLLLLTYLTAEQALACLQEQADNHVTAHDLYSHCLEGHLPAYIKAGEDGIEGEHGFSQVYGVGYHQVLNPNSLFAGREKFTATLVGDVLAEPDPEAGRPVRVEWVAELDPNRYQVHFKTNDVVQLAEDIIEASSNGPSQKAILMTVGALLELLIESSPRKYSQESINAHIHKKYNDKRGLGQRNLEEIFSQANQALHPSD